MSEDKSNISSLKNKLIIIIFGLSGLTALVYEIVWIRPLSLVFGTTIYAVTIIISAFLSGLALGSWIAGKYSDRIDNPLKFFGIVEIGIGLYGILLISMFSILPELYLNIYKATFPNFSLFFVLQFVLAFSIILIPTTMMGTTLIFMMKAYSRSFSNIGRDLGRMYSANNIGAVLGTIAAGFMFIPIFGIQNSIMITVVLNICLGLIALYLSKSSFKKILLVSVIILLVGSFSVYDFKILQFGMYIYADPKLDINNIKNSLESQEIEFYKESTYSTINVLGFDDSKILKINGRVQCSNAPIVIEGMNRLAYVPYEMYQGNYNEKPNNALNMGLGCGYTSKWLSENIKTTTIEIDPIMVDASKIFTNVTNHELIIDDVRNWLSRNEVKYDLIVSQPADPYNGWYMFTQEFFALVDSKLTDNGIFSIWIPAFDMNLNDFYIVYNTFHSVFPYVHIYQQEEGSAQLLFIGSHKELQVIDKNLYIISEKDIPEIITVINTDDRPILEFSTSLNIYSEDPRPIFEKFKEWSGRK